MFVFHLAVYIAWQLQRVVLPFQLHAVHRRARHQSRVSNRRADVISLLISVVQVDEAATAACSMYDGS
jgi:hypothetical protein